MTAEPRDIAPDIASDIAPEAASEIASETAARLPEYVATGIDSRAGRDGDDADEWAPPQAPAMTIDERVGLAILRLRLYRGLSQVKLERISGVDQTTISRLENAKCRGLSIRRLFALLKALRADDITFGPGPRLPQSSWEDAMHGDLWERAGRAAEARVNRRRSA